MNYFDYATTTPVDQEILDTYVAVTNKYFAHSGVNKEIEELEIQSKEIIMNLLKFNKEKYQVVYTSGGSEANNLAIKGVAQRYKGKKHFITTEYEHSSVYESFKYLETQGHEVTYIKPLKTGEINVEEVLGEIKDNTVLVEIMHVNNECGAINNIELIAKKLKLKNESILFMTDAVQAIGKTNLINPENIDFMTISGHKIYAPKGVGALIMPKKVNVATQIHGGTLELGIRGGTQNLASQIAFAKALKITIMNLDKNLKKVTEQKSYLMEKLKKIPEIKFNTVNESNIISLQIKIEMQSESVVKLLSEKGFYISTKSACSTKLNKGSRTLNSLGLTIDEQNHSYRISLSYKTTIKEIDGLVVAIHDIIKKIK